MTIQFINRLWLAFSIIGSITLILVIILFVLLLSGCSDEPAVTIKLGEPQFIVVQRIDSICPMKHRCIYDTTYDTILPGPSSLDVTPRGLDYTPTSAGQEYLSTRGGK